MNQNARIRYNEMISTIADLITIGEDKVAIELSVTLGSYEVEDHLYQMIQIGRLDADCLPTSFGELHDSCDANEFGGLCTDEVFGSLEMRAEADSGLSDFVCNFANEVQDRINARLAAGEIKAQRHTII